VRLVISAQQTGMLREPQRSLATVQGRYRTQMRSVCMFWPIAAKFSLDFTSAFGAQRKWAGQQSSLPRSKMTQGGRPAFGLKSTKIAAPEVPLVPDSIAHQARRLSAKP
jgi:hypothetical protein